MAVSARRHSTPRQVDGGGVPPAHGVPRSNEAEHGRGVESSGEGCHQRTRRGQGQKPAVTFLR
ncbi:hypothetical protein GZL_03358 [Streptomyces sp. 769]|nr:hypothetical protein GZL_03358 [Streptomyces sp. 769]